jgi:hypothetical protein
MMDTDDMTSAVWLAWRFDAAERTWYSDTTDEGVDYGAVADALADARRALSDRDTRIATLTGELTEARRETSMRAARADTLTADLRLIADMLRNEAQRREWCSEYGDWIDVVNARTSSAWLRHCAETEDRTYIVTFRLTGNSDQLSDGWNAVESALYATLDNAADLDTEESEVVDVHAR